MQGLLKVYITGMSGTGKSTVLHALAAHGHQAVDTDSDVWSEWVTLPDGSTDWILREQAMQELLANHTEGKLFVAGCKSNQGQFYRHFDHIVLLSAPAPILLDRIAKRTNNPYGKKEEEREQILKYLVTVEPLLRATATEEIDASLPLDEVVRMLESLE